MVFLRQSYQTLFGRTSIDIKGAFYSDEIVDRFNVVLSPNFTSQHLKHVIVSRFDGKKLELKYGSPYQNVGNGRIVRTYYPHPIVNVRFSGKLKPVGSRAFLKGHIEALLYIKIIALILSALLGASILLWVPVVWFFPGNGVLLVMLIYGFLVPSVTLFFMLKILMDKEKNLIEFLQWVMVEPLE